MVRKVEGEKEGGRERGEREVIDRRRKSSSSFLESVTLKLPPDL
jgi:hypothetical protein